MISPNLVSRPALVRLHALTKPVRGHTHASRFEAMAQHAGGISGGRQAVLGLLLSAALPRASIEPSVFRPIWANEAMQRAYDIVCLVGTLERSCPIADMPPAFLATEAQIAAELASAYSSLDVMPDGQTQSCSGALRTIVRALVELFGGRHGRATIRTEIQRIAMPAFQRRAIVLVASRLVMNALLQGNDKQTSIGVSCIRHGRNAASLRVVSAKRAGPDPRSDDNLADLASLLNDGVVSTSLYADREELEVSFRILAPGSIGAPATLKRLSPLSAKVHRQEKSTRARMVATHTGAWNERDIGRFENGRAAEHQRARHD